MEGLVSILIPVYNVEKYVRKSVQSVIEQTYKNIEIILVDDGSTDSSGDICDEYSKKDNRVSVIHQKNQGVSVARNVALERAQGEYIFWIDADDYIDRNTVSVLIRHLNRKNADVVVFGYKKIYSNGRKQDVAPSKKVLVIDKEEFMRQVHYGDVGAGFCNKFFKRSVLADFKFKPGIIIGEDYGGLWEIYPLLNKVVLCPDILYYYVQRKDSVSYRGYSPQKSAYVLNNYRNLRYIADEKYPNICDSTFAYCILQEMAVVISMIKADHYDSVLIRDIQKEIRKNLGRYCRLKEVPFYLKGCAVLLSLHYKCLSVPYRKFFRRRMTA